MKRIKIIFAVGVCLMGLVLSGICLAEDVPMKTVTAAAGPDGVQKVDITAGEYFFDPNHIIVKVNQPVELSIRKAGGFIPHVISMKSAEAGMNFEESIGKEPKIIRFTPTKPGNYPFLCTKKPPFLKSHADRGMKGVIEVIE